MKIRELLAIIVLMPLCAFAGPSDIKTSMETRHGTVEVREGSENTAIVFRGKTIASIAAESAALFRIKSTGASEYLIVRAWHPGLNCHHFYLLLELSQDSSKVSQEFGECGELGGAGLAAAEPVVHLKDPVNAQGGVTSYQWTSGEIVKAFESPSVCSAVGFLARKNAAPIATEAPARVAGLGRLQFLSAPDKECPMPGVFVVPGDRLMTSFSFEGFVFAGYINPKTGRKVQGWVQRERLSD